MTKPIQKSKAQARVLDVLQSLEIVNSAELSQLAGVRNVPDAVMKLRRKGHIIEMRMCKGASAGVYYENIGLYHYKGINTIRVSDYVTVTIGTINKVPITPRMRIGTGLGMNIEKLELGSKKDICK